MIRKFGAVQTGMLLLQFGMELLNGFLFPQGFSYLAQLIQFLIQGFARRLIRVALLFGQEPGQDTGRRSSMTGPTMDIDAATITKLLLNELHRCFQGLQGWFKMIGCRKMQLGNPQFLILLDGTFVFFTKVDHSTNLSKRTQMQGGECRYTIRPSAT